MELSQTTDSTLLTSPENEDNVNSTQPLKDETKETKSYIVNWKNIQSLDDLKTIVEILVAVTQSTIINFTFDKGTPPPENILKLFTELPTTTEKPKAEMNIVE